MASDDEVKLEMIEDEDDAGEDGPGSVSGDPDPSHPRRRGRNMCLDDGVSRIDFILAWEVPEKKDEQDADVLKAKKARQTFEANLDKEGLKLEQDLRDEKVHFTKVHAPWEVLTRYAEILKMKKQMKETRIAEKIQTKYSKWENPVKAVSTTIWNTINTIKRTVRGPFELDKEVLPKIRKEATLAFNREREYLFDIPEQKEKFFSVSERSYIVDFILRRQAFEEMGEEKTSAYTFDKATKASKASISKMLSDGFYSSAYPLHEGHWKAGSVDNDRKRLYDHWAHWKKFYKIQPLEYIRNYYGSKIAMYFAWLGFYTQMLVVPSIIGLIIFIYGVAYMDDSYPSKEVCNPVLNFTMCPMCDYQCPYWNLHDACGDSKYSRMFDNNGTLFFAIFMSLWGTLFLEFWKRKQAVIQHKWDLTDFVKEEEPPRPEYLAKLANYPRMKINPITGLQEPHLPFWRKRFPIFLMSYGIMLFTMCLALAGVVGVIAYRVSTYAALQLLEKNEVNASSATQAITQNASIITTVTAACINVTIIIILNIIYGRVVLWLTDFETLRTQSEYEDSINIKLFSLQFVNYYSSIIYIAFFKGRLVGRPGAYNMAFGARQEECGSGGCLIELCLQLAIIMAGKQFIQNNLLEIVLPKTIKWLKRCYRRKILKETKEEKAAMPGWEKDYQLDATGNTSLYHEYLEMVLQFGFLTIFVAAFPLGPLCCLLNNIIEIRSDAMKLICDMRRPVSERLPDIGIWFQILYSISRLAIVSNAFIIALTSDFIPRLVFVYYESNNGTLDGYTDWTLSYFNTSDFEDDKMPRPGLGPSVDLCRYKDFRNPPWAGDKERYKYSEAHWHVLAARFAFVVCFENFIVVITSLIAYLIPDVPAKVKKQIRREAYIANEIVIQTESRKARGEAPVRGILGSLLDKIKPSKKEENGGDLRHRDLGRDTSEVVIERDPNDKSHV